MAGQSEGRAALRSRGRRTARSRSRFAARSAARGPARPGPRRALRGAASTAAAPPTPRLLLPLPKPEAAARGRARVLGGSGTVTHEAPGRAGPPGMRQAAPRRSAASSAATSRPVPGGRPRPEVSGTGGGAERGDCGARAPFGPRFRAGGGGGGSRALGPGPRGEPVPPPPCSGRSAAPGRRGDEREVSAVRLGTALLLARGLVRGGRRGAARGGRREAAEGRKGGQRSAGGRRAEPCPGAEPRGAAGLRAASGGCAAVGAGHVARSVRPLRASGRSVSAGADGASWLFLCCCFFFPFFLSLRVFGVGRGG